MHSLDKDAARATKPHPFPRIHDNYAWCWRSRTVASFVVLACLAVLLTQRPTVRGRSATIQEETLPAATHAPEAWDALGPEGLTACPRPAATESKPIAVGSEIRTDK